MTKKGKITKFGQKVKKFDLARMVRDIVINPKGGYQGTFRLCHRPRNVWVILVILTIFGIWAKGANFRQNVKKVKKSKNVKLWHVAYQITGIFDEEVKYRIHVVEIQNFGPNFWTKNSKVKILEFFFHTMACGISNCWYFDGEFQYGIHSVETQD